MLEPLSCPSCDGPRPARPEDCLADCTFRCLLYLLAPLDCSTEAKPFYFQLARCRRRRSQQQKLSHCETELSIVNPPFHSSLTLFHVINLHRANKCNTMIRIKRATNARASRNKQTKKKKITNPTEPYYHLVASRLLALCAFAQAGNGGACNRRGHGWIKKQQRRQQAHRPRSTRPPCSGAPSS